MGESVYIPLGFLKPKIICSNKLQIIPKASLFMFGILESIMHMTWTKYVCGRLESRLSYSPSVYNNFPWPESPTDKQIKAVESKYKKNSLQVNNLTFKYIIYCNFKAIILH